MMTRQARFISSLFLALLWFGLHTPQATAAAKAEGNPRPSPGDLVLPMPGGLTMVFRPVFIGKGDGPLALRRITLGGDGNNFKEQSTAVAIGGAFIGQHDGHSDWLYYMGKYEVTETQYAAVMGPAAQSKRKAAEDPNMPVVDLTPLEVETFLDKYNLWLFAQAQEKLPKNQGAVGFLRLSTEAEWEFAARGGNAVSENDFDKRLPYTGNLAEFEWFSGPKSSHDKLKPIGQLRPNPLGIHDMLGNASEMTSALYQLEYYQGRTGGFVARGGSYKTEENELRSSQRVEQPFYSLRGEKRLLEPFHRPDLSFRLVISSVVIPSQAASKSIEEAWDDYRKGAGATLPAALSQAPDQTKEGVRKDDALVHMERLKQYLTSSGQVQGETAQELHYLETALRDIDAQRREVDERNAFTWILTATDRADFLHRQAALIVTLNKAKTLAEQDKATQRIESYTQRLKEVEQNIKEASERYSDALRQLGHCLPQSVDKGLAEYRKKVRDNPAQLKVFEVVAKQQASLRASGRVDMETWLKELADVQS